MHRSVAALLSAFAIAASVAVADAQWLNYPTPGIPRTSNGKPDLNAPVPTTPDGKPDLTGLWRVNPGIAYAGNIVADLADNDVLPWADALSRQRMSDFGKDDPGTVGCLPRGPRNITGGSGGANGPVTIVQSPTVIVMAYEELSYRRIYMDGRPLPKDPTPTFMGYSVGRWEGNVLVVESVGFDQGTWLDAMGHPHTEALRITERYRRTSFGRIELQVTFEDPGAYRRPWTVPVSLMFAADTDMMESVCDRTPRHTLTGRTTEQQRISVPPSTLSDYAGTYVPVQVRSVGSDLFLDLDGKGKWLLVPISTTEVSVRLFNLKFQRNDRGLVTQLVVIPGFSDDVVLTKQR
jgi:hypothetical protein